MQIDPAKCVACSNCVPICPMGAIYVDPAVNRATINLDECVECGTCARMSSEALEPVYGARGTRVGEAVSFSL